MNNDIFKNRFSSFNPEDRNIYPFPTDPYLIKSPISATESGYEISWMIGRDLPEVIALSGKSEQEIRNYLKDRATIGIVLKAKENIIGYVIYKLFPEYIQILSIDAYPPKEQRLESLLDKIISKLNPSRRNKIVMYINEKILQYKNALKWLKKLGFTGEPLGHDKIAFTYYDIGKEYDYFPPIEGNPEDLNEVAPPGWSGSITAMKRKHPEIKNPYALGWSMYNKGYKPHYKPMPNKSTKSKGKLKKYKKYKKRKMKTFREFLEENNLNL